MDQFAVGFRLPLPKHDIDRVGIVHKEVSGLTYDLALFAYIDGMAKGEAKGFELSHIVGGYAERQRFDVLWSVLY